MTSIPQLPEFVSTILITGGGGYVGTEVAKLLIERYPSVSLILSDLRAPPSLGPQTTSIASDLSDPKAVSALFDDRTIDAVFAFQGIMSGGSEQDFELGYKVNVDSHRALLDAARKAGSKRSDGNKILYIYTSSIAVYGGDKCKPESFVDPETTPIFPESSYGAQKLAVELFTFDYTRKGFIDGRILRLPTVAIRTGAPSSAASSFNSGLIREPLQGIPSECPIADSIDDPAMDSIKLWLSRAKTVFENIIYALTIPAERFPAHSRSVNVPGITITPRQIIEALEEAGGKKAVDLVTYKKDPAIMRITKSWAGEFDNKLALGLGFKVDDTKTGFSEAVKDFQATLVK